MFLLAGLAACESGRARPTAGARRSGEEGASNPIPRMEGTAVYFDGQIEAEVLLARVGAHWNRADVPGQNAARRAGGGGFNGRVGGMGGGRGGHHGGRGGPPEGGGSADEPPTAPVHASNLPPLALRLRLTNHGGVAADVEVVDFNSSLGDFVVEPPRLTLPPGQAVEAEPMVSRLGVGTEEIPLTVKLRLGHRSEQQVLTLRVVKEPDAAAPVPVPPAVQAPPP